MIIWENQGNISKNGRIRSLGFPLKDNKWANKYCWYQLLLLLESGLWILISGIWQLKKKQKPQNIRARLSEESCCFCSKENTIWHFRFPAYHSSYPKSAVAVRIATYTPDQIKQNSFLKNCDKWPAVGSPDL